VQLFIFRFSFDLGFVASGFIALSFDSEGFNGKLT
jgi:hypothetical protein